MKYIQYPEDCKRIKDLCLSHCWSVSLEEADEMWSNYSDGMCAGWMFLPESDSLLWELIEHEMENLLNHETLLG